MRVELKGLSDVLHVGCEKMRHLGFWQLEEWSCCCQRKGRLQRTDFLHFVKTVGFSYEIGGNEGSSRKKGKPGLETGLSDVPSVIPLFAALIVRLFPRGTTPETS